MNRLNIKAVVVLFVVEVDENVEPAGPVEPVGVLAFGESHSIRHIYQDLRSGTRLQSFSLFPDRKGDRLDAQEVVAKSPPKYPEWDQDAMQTSNHSVLLSSILQDMAFGQVAHTDTPGQDL